jgi:hypothetical protein
MKVRIAFFTDRRNNTRYACIGLDDGNFISFAQRRHNSEWDFEETHIRLQGDHIRRYEEQSEIEDVSDFETKYPDLFEKYFITLLSGSIK